MKVKAALVLLAAVAMAPLSSATGQTEAPKVDRPVWLPPGSTWTANFKLSGSLGSGTRDQTTEALGEVDWDGRRVVGLLQRGGAHSYFDAQRRLLGFVRDGKPIQTYHPYEALYDWPLLVGKSWSSEFQVKYHARDQALDFKFVFSVEAFEEVTTPAGTFKAFRIRRSSPNDRYVVWYDPVLGLEVKRDWERFATHPFGVGTHQMEMVSYAIKN